MNGPMRVSDDENVVTTFALRIIANADTDMGEEALEDLRNVVADHLERVAEALMEQPAIQLIAPAEGIRVAWVVEP